MMESRCSVACSSSKVGAGVRRTINIISAVLILAVALRTTEGQSAEFWNDHAKATLEKALKLQHLNVNVAKNIVLFLGDGLDIATSTAARIRKGQLAGQTGEEASLEWDKFSHVALSKTYNTDLQTGDSAGTATAFLCGVKSKSRTLGVDDRVQYGNCTSAEGSEVDSILKLAQKAGKSTGFVTTTRVTHATPAGLYANTPNRGWESDDYITETQRGKGCKDIALQLIENGRDINVILGGGRKHFLTNVTLDPEYDDGYGKRTDGRNLIEEWLELRDNPDRSRYVWNQEDFKNVDADKVDYLLGLFEDSHMQYESARNVKDGAGEPGIWEMTEKAIKILRKNKNGYFLMVEGGRIDHGHHKGVAYDALHETLAFDKAVAAGLKLIDTEDTLVVVTADHGHVMTMSGYQSRGNPIFGVIDDYNANDGLPYATLSYANGPGASGLNASFHTTGTRKNLTGVDLEDEDYEQPALVPLSSETHGGQDVAIYARGPMAHLFHGVHEQNYVAHVMMYAACLGEYQQDHCNVKYREKFLYGAAAPSRNVNNARILVLSQLVLLFVLYFLKD